LQTKERKDTVVQRTENPIHGLAGFEAPISGWF
jgi:hypothetical protein